MQQQSGLQWHQFTAPCDGRKHAELVFLIPKHKWQNVHGLSGARSGQGLCPKWPWDVWYLFCQWGPLAPFYSPVSKGMVSLEGIGEMEIDRMEQMCTDSHFGCRYYWKMKSSPLYTVFQLASQWKPGPVACHGRALCGHRRWMCRKIFSDL